ncbi:MAG: hypothetical protein K9N48_03585 [Verrucomicrobia bacterium]|nr:hypothetical protein [Verrucomicrobiota bacterium]MCF7707793.1 hypothetical protein [Verrucomicrobiota bacterium]
MKKTVFLIFLFALIWTINGGSVPPARGERKPEPPPPVKIAPSENGGRVNVETRQVVTKKQVTNVVPVTNYVVVTNEVLVTNTYVVTNPVAVEEYDYLQRLYSGEQYLIPPEKAGEIIGRFRDAYEELGRPPFLVYINRRLVDLKSGTRISKGTRKTITTGSKSEFTTAPGTGDAASGSGASMVRDNENVIVVGDVKGESGDRPGKRSESEWKIIDERSYAAGDRSDFSLADSQTVREVERLLGRPLRMAGVTLVDQKLATQMMEDTELSEVLESTGGAQARKDREAINKIADVALEVLVSSREVVAAEVSGEKRYTVPDIQLTAVRLSDSKIIGQASSSDIIGEERLAGRIARLFNVRDITEATAFALMEDILLNMEE